MPPPGYGPDDAFALMEGLWAPTRDPAQLVALGDIARRSDSREEAWEAFAGAGLIPLEWVDGRSFKVFESRGVGADEGTAQAVALASDPVGLATALSLLSEVAEASAPWRQAPSGARLASPEAPSDLRPMVVAVSRETLEGVLVERLRRQPIDLGALRRAARTVRRTAQRTAWDEATATLLSASGERDPGSPLYRYIEEIWRLGSAWALAVAEGRRLPRPLGGGGRDDAIADRAGGPFAALRDPFSPLLGLFALGYFAEMMVWSPPDLGVPSLTARERRLAGL